MMDRYRVQNLKDNTYQVLRDEYDEYDSVAVTYCEYQGSLADCEAYIRLQEGGYM